MTDQYIEAAHPASSLPNRIGNTLPNGRVMPPMRLRHLSDKFGRIVDRHSYNVGSATHVPETFLSGKTGVASPPGMVIYTPPPGALGPSVVGTLLSATPVANIVAVARDIPGVAQRPLIPPGLRGRVASAMPPGMRMRAAAWGRAAARVRSPRPTNARVPRE